MEQQVVFPRIDNPADWAPPESFPPIGVVVTKPGPRPAAVRNVYPVPAGVRQMFEAAIKAANPNARVSDASYDEPDVYGNVGYSPDMCPVAVESDPPMRFEFSRVEWLGI